VHRHRARALYWAMHSSRRYRIIDHVLSTEGASFLSSCTGATPATSVWGLAGRIPSQTSVFEIISLTNYGKALELSGKISHGRSLGSSDCPSEESEASLGSRAAPRDFPRAAPSGNPSEQPCFLGRLQTLPRDSLRTLGTSLGKIFPDYSCGFSTICPRPNTWKTQK
jgi:hypothetical protein